MGKKTLHTLPSTHIPLFTSFALLSKSAKESTVKKLLGLEAILLSSNVSTPSPYQYRANIHFWRSIFTQRTKWRQIWLQTPNLLLEAKVKQNMCNLDIYSTFTPPLQKSKLSLLNKICQQEQISSNISTLNLQ